MGEDSFFNALFHIMWNMETDIFSEKEKTLGLLGDIVPKCKKQRKRIEAMYDCGAMDFIEQAVADRDRYELNMKRAVRVLVNELNLSVEKALFSVNQIAELWDGDLEMLKNYDENENLEDEDDNDKTDDDEYNGNYENNENNEYDENTVEEESKDDENSDEEQASNNSQTEPESESACESVTDDNNNKENNENNEKDGEEDMIFLQEVAEEENAEVQEEQPAEAPAEGGGEEEQAPPPPPPRESLLKKVLEFWCKSELEEGRPYMAACPIGWILILLCSALGAFMIYDIPLGDKFVVPTFALMFSVLTSKRLYRYESSGRFSLLVGAFYLAAMGRVLWLGKGYPPIACVPMVLAALVVFNSGRIGTMLDEAKKNSFFAYIIITVFSVAITVGAYAIQQVEF